MISICIPTYNRAEQLDRLLNSIPDYNWIQICVSNNASPDNTLEVIRKHNTLRQHKIKYFQQIHNTGLNKNVVKSLTMADNQYCLAITDDDYFLTGALDAVKCEIENAPSMTHFFSCITYYEKSNRCEISQYKYYKNSDLTSAMAIFRAHIHSGVVFQKQVIAETLTHHRKQVEENIYVQYPFSAIAINSGNFRLHSMPILVHTWENDTFWGANPRSEKVSKQYYQSFEYIKNNIVSTKAVNIELEKKIKQNRNIIYRIIRKISRVLYFKTLEW